MVPLQSTKALILPKINIAIRTFYISLLNYGFIIFNLELIMEEVVESIELDPYLEEEVVEPIET